MKKAFTLIELVVAVALLAMVLGFASVIFKVSIEAYRTAGANTEIMQKLRAITDQLNTDFKGAIWNPQGKVHFDFDNSDIDGKTVTVRSDSIVFFANGDFQSTRQYGPSGNEKTVVGNVASIFYGLANIPSYTPEERQDPKKKILIRRQTILTSDSPLPGSDQLGEHYNKSLAELIADPSFDADVLIDANFAPDDANDLVMYMAKGVDDFSIQYVGTENPPEDKKFYEWRPENEDIELDEWENKFFTPLAFKFTFTLYDSKGIIEKGRRFTHIVYLRD